LVIAFPQLVGHDPKVAVGGPEIDIQQMLQEDSNKTSSPGASSPGDLTPPPASQNPGQSDDDITKAFKN